MTRFTVLCFLAAFLAGCSPSAREREAQALMVGAKSLEASTREDDIMRASAIYANLSTNYKDTSVARRALDDWKRLKPKVNAIIVRHYQDGLKRVQQAARDQ